MQLHITKIDNNSNNNSKHFSCAYYVLEIVLIVLVKVFYLILTIYLWSTYNSHAQFKDENTKAQGN